MRHAELYRPQRRFPCPTKAMGIIWFYICLAAFYLLQANGTMPGEERVLSLACQTPHTWEGKHFPSLNY